MSKMILVIEDEHDIRNNIKRALELSHFKIIDADNGRAGIELAKQYHPDLILSDIMMNGIDGFQVLKELQENEDTSSIPFLFLTAKSSKFDIRDGMNLGADDYITKPFDIDELLNAVNARLKKKEQIAIGTEKKFDELRNNISRAIPHEIRTPLNIILGLSEYLGKNFDNIPAKDSKMMLNNIKENGQRLNHLFENYVYYSNLLLLAANPEELTEQRARTTYLSKHLLYDIIQNYAASEERDEDLKLKIEDVSVRISEFHFNKIVLELLSNSIKFSDKGSTIEIYSNDKGKNLELIFKDYGRGMTGAQIKKIGAYMQFDRHFYEHQGSGLGVAIVKKILDLFEGKMEIKSDGRSWTEIRIEIPKV